MSIPAKPVHTPWGWADSETVYAEGVIFYGTPSHGGFWLDPERNAKVHPLLREPDGWHEEDCAWAKIAWTFPELFSEKDWDAAVWTLKTWYPDAWEAITGEVLEPGESYVKDERTFREAHKDDWVVISASRSSAHPGMVECVAMCGGRPASGRTGPERRYLVPAAEYAARGHFGFVIDETRHARLDDPNSSPA